VVEDKTMELTAVDIDLLLQAVEAWEKAGEQQEFMGDLLTAMLSRDDEQRQRLEAQREEQARMNEPAHRARKERGVLLRAKLITLREQFGNDRMR
jgi:hypothetical protein